MVIPKLKQFLAQRVICYWISLTQVLFHTTVEITLSHSLRKKQNLHLCWRVQSRVGNYEEQPEQQEKPAGTDLWC